MGVVRFLMIATEIKVSNVRAPTVNSGASKLCQGLYVRIGV